MKSESSENIRNFAEEAGAAADLAILHSELTGDHPTLIALRGARVALDKIRLAAEMDLPPMDTGQL